RSRGGARARPAEPRMTLPNARAEITRSEHFAWPAKANGNLQKEAAVEDRAPQDPSIRFFRATVKHYEIIRPLGEGGMGAVFLARDDKLGRLVALKVLLDHTTQSAISFLSEARATARCKHENIVVIHEVDEIDGVPYMVLEHLEGRTLREWMAERKEEPG